MAPPEEVYSAPGREVAHWNDLVATPGGTIVDLAAKLDRTDTILVQSEGAADIKVNFSASPTASEGTIVREKEDAAFNLNLSSFVVYGASITFHVTAIKRY